MEIKTKLSEKDFIDVNFTLLLNRLSTKFYMVLALLMTALLIYSSIESGRPVSVIIYPFVFLFILPLITYITAKINYKSNPRIKETIEYKFGNELLEVKGESFSSQLTWNKIYKVTKTKKWILVWQSRQIANVIHLRDVWAGDITTLKEILDKHRVKNNL